MPQFKEGDRVVYTGADPIISSKKRVGMEGVITLVIPGAGICVAFDCGVVEPGILAANLKLVEVTPTVLEAWIEARRGVARAAKAALAARAEMELATAVEQQAKARFESWMAREIVK